MTKIIAGTYEILERIGSGGGGNVYLAYHRRLEKRVVLKADKRRISTREALLRKEVDVLKELDIPHVPRVYDFFVENGTAYTVMDYIEGESLDQPLKRGETYSQAQVICWAVQLLEALSQLHAPIHGNPPKGYVHSDIKPANLMRTPRNDIYLIDFNIALALGETRVIGASAGYASPEHYGLDFSTEGSLTYSKEEAGDTDVMPGGTEILGDARSGVSPPSGYQPNATTSGKRLVIPDVRSDIYSVGATLYHLLSGTRPAKEALQVVPLSEEEYSPQIVAIISKAMNPNPDLRFQSADEMLEALYSLRRNDPRVRAWKRRRLAAGIVFPSLFAVSIAAAFLGLKRMQTAEKWLKLSGYAREALDAGNVDTAVDYAMQVLSEKPSLLTPKEPAGAGRVLTEALGVYDFSGNYRAKGILTLPSELLGLQLAPDGSTAVCISSGLASVADMDNLEVRMELPLAASALSEVRYLDSDRIVYAGETGIRCVKLSSGAEIWSGQPATAVRVSEDGSTAVSVYKEDREAVLYDAEQGTVLRTIDFGEKYQSAAVNDLFANPENHLLSLNVDGSVLAVSFGDGSLELIDLEEEDHVYELLDGSEGYGQFEGGFSGRYFAFTASSQESSVFAVVDTETMEQTGGFETTESVYHVKVDENGIFIQSDNILVEIDPVTGEQRPLVTTAEKIGLFSTDGRNTLITTEDALLYYDENASLMETYQRTDGREFVELRGSCAAVGSMDSPVVRILEYEDCTDAQFFAYDPAYVHSEARVSADGKTVMLFGFDHFRVYGVDGALLAETAIPDAEQVYDQQYRRRDGMSVLEVLYNNGTLRSYDAGSGELLEESTREKPDPELYEEFETDDYRIESPLHGAPAVYEKKSGKLVRKLSEDAYLSYVTQVGEQFVLQYITSDGICYGQLMNQSWEITADLPYLCDVKDEILYFDYPSGNVRRSRILNIDEIKQLVN